MRYLLVIIAIFSVSACQYTPNTPNFDKQLNWKLVYSHDKNGATTFGSKEELLQYARTGHPIRIVWPIRDDFVHVFDAGFLSIMGNDLLAQVTPIVKQNPDFTTGTIELDYREEKTWHAILSTSGDLKSFMSGEKSQSEYRFALQWYVQAPTEF